MIHVKLNGQLLLILGLLLFCSCQRSQNIGLLTSSSPSRAGFVQEQSSLSKHPVVRKNNLESLAVGRNRDEIERLRAKKVGKDSVFISAQTGEGIPRLIDRLEEIFAGKREILKYLIPLSRYELVARLRAQGELTKEETTDDGYTILGSPRDGLIHALEEFRVSN